MGQTNTQTQDMDAYYDEYGGDFTINHGKKMGGGSGKKKQNKKEKSKGAAETIYNSKHIRVAEQKKANGKKKQPK
jgi:hypothetical protein|tara:strand:+ start:890 stop:1114 length:225 start_codon:yes stop_codon:yes gene_type:complete